MKCEARFVHLLSFVFLSVILLNRSLLAQSSRGPVGESNWLMNAQEPRAEVSSSLPDRLKGARFAEPTAGTRKATPRPSPNPQASGLNFAPTVPYSSGSEFANSIAVGDLNGDGISDLVVANSCVSPSSCATGGVGVLIGNGDGTFKTAVTYGSGAPYAFSVSIADVNGDGKLDLVVANYCTNLYVVQGCQNPVDTVGVLLGNGDGTFQAAVTYSSGGYGNPGNFQSGSVAVADVNGDGKPDLLMTNPCGDNSCTTNGIVGVMWRFPIRWSSRM